MNFLFSKKSLSAGSSMLDLIMGVSAVGVIGGILFAVMTFGPSSEDSIETTETSADAPGGPGGPGGRPGRSRESIKVLEQFDADRNGWLNTSERQAALAHLETQSPDGAAVGARGPRGGGFRGGPGSGGE